MERTLELPDVGEGIAEGEIVRWLVEPGDDVTEDQPIAEVETDKAVVEVPAPIDGTVVTLHAEEGEVVAVESVIVTFEVDGDAADAATSDTDATETDASGDDAETPADAGTDSMPDADQQATVPAGDVPASQVVAPPRVKRLARELGVAIGSLPGAADGTPITETDVRAAAGQETVAATAQQAGTDDGSTGPPDATARSQTQASEPRGTTGSVPAPAGGATGTADREKTLAAPATRQLARELGVDIDAVPASEERNGTPFVTPADVESFDDGTATAQSAGAQAGRTRGQPPANGQREEREAYRGIRRTIGERMAESKYTAPHVAHHDSADVSQLTAARRELSEELADDVSLTYLPFVLKAVVSALEAYPMMNATLDEDAEEVVKKHYYNVGVATATDAGLMVPVIRDVDRKGVAQLAREIDDLVSRARNRQISPDEMQGGTFTVTNFGAIGGDHATPIINYPEAAILGLGTIKKRPVVVERETTESSRNASGATASDEVVPRETLPLSLSVDHRLIDGAIAASFTNDVKRSLQNPTRMLLW